MPIPGTGSSGGSASPRPDSEPTTSAASSTVRVITPTVSNVSEIAFTPTHGSVPWVGLYPTTPQNAAGRTIDPVVCVANATGTMPAATAAADPDDEPPGVRVGSCGFVVDPGGHAANSVVTSFPRTTMPRCRAIATLAASAGGRWPS